jgi:membrane protein DedA with SNARE-associated domain
MRFAFLEAFIQDWGFLGVFLGIIATGLGFPMPEELPVVIGGGLAGHQSGDRVFMILMLITCIVGVIVGDSFLYLIGRIWGTRLVETRFFRERVLPPERLATITDNFHKYGVKILLFARLTPGIRAPIFLTAGISRMSMAKFLIADGLYAIPGVSLLFFLGYFFTERMIAIIEAKAELVKAIIILVILGSLAAYLVYRFLRKPVVMGNPRDVPTIMEPVAYGTDQVTKQILHPENHDLGSERPTAPVQTTPPA